MEELDSHRYRLRFPDGTSHTKSLRGPVKRPGDVVAVGDTHWLVVNVSEHDDEDFAYELVLTPVE